MRLVSFFLHQSLRKIRKVGSNVVSEKKKLNLISQFETKMINLKKYFMSLPDPKYSPKIDSYAMHCTGK